MAGLCQAGQGWGSAVCWPAEVREFGAFPGATNFCFEHLCISWTFEGFLHNGWVIDLLADNTLCLWGVGVGREGSSLSDGESSISLALREFSPSPQPSAEQCATAWPRQTACLPPGSAAHLQFPAAHFPTCCDLVFPSVKGAPSMSSHAFYF